MSRSKAEIDKESQDLQTTIGRDVFNSSKLNNALQTLQKEIEAAMKRLDECLNEKPRCEPPPLPVEDTLDHPLQ